MTREEKEVICRRFRRCLGRAALLLDVMSGQDCTDPTYSDLLDIMSLRSGLEDDSLRMEKKLNYFLQYDKIFINEVVFYEEVSALGRATEETVDDALSVSGEFLRSMTDVDGIFQSSKTDCLWLASDIMAFVDRGIDVDPTEAGDLMELRRIQGNL